MLAGMIKIGLPMGFYVVANQILLNLDLWALKALRPNEGEVIGHYVAAANIGKLLTAVPSVLIAPFFAALAWRIAQGETKLGRLHIAQAVRVASLAIVPGAVLLGVNAQEALGLLFSGAYGGGAIFLAILVIGFAIFALFDIFFHALLAIGRQQLVALILLALIGAVLGLDLLLIPALGGVGAAVAMSVGMAVGTVVAAVLAARVFGSILPLGSLARVSVCGAVVGLLSAAIPTQGITVGIEILAMMLIYAALLLLTRELTWQELKSVFHSR